MNLKHLKIVSSILILLIGLNGFSKDLTNIEKSVMFLEKGLNQHDETTLDFISDKTYIQHNLRAQNGKEGLKKYLIYLKTKKMEGDVVRVFEDNNYVVTQRLSKLGDIYRHVIDIFRFENNLIVEHWDNIEYMKNPIDIINNLPTKVSDLDKTAENKKLVENYLKDKKYFKNHMILGQGDFILSVSETKKDENDYSLYELFYINNGKIEHIWKVEEKIPPKDQWKNSNGKF